MAYFVSRESFVTAGLTYANHNELSEKECNICYHPYQAAGVDSVDKDTDVPTRLPCSHVFGRRCILRWTRESNTCPYCRAILFDRQDEKPHVSRNLVEATIQPLATRELISYEPVNSGSHNSYTPTGALYARRRAATGAPSHVRGTLSRICDICARRHGAQECPLELTRQIALSPGVPQNMHTAMRVITQAARLLAACFNYLLSKWSKPWSIAEELLEVDISSSDAAMHDLIRSHHQWMAEVAEEIGFDDDEDEEEEEDLFWSPNFL